MPVPVADAAPRALRGDVTPEFDVPAVVAACPICLLAPSSEPEAEDTAFPCCNAFTHLTCLVRCAHAHGTCPNCRAAIDHLPREPGIVARCQALGINMHPADAPASDTAFAVVRDYSVRTFSRADAAELPEPVLIRAVCCNRLAGPAFDFAELPDARMHWAPLPRRGTDGIETWLPQWICMRCQNELPFENVRMPSPTPACPMCHTPMLWRLTWPGNRSGGSAADALMRMQRDHSLRRATQPAYPTHRLALPTQLEMATACHSAAPALTQYTTAPHPCPCATALTLPCTCLSYLTRRACLRRRRSLPGARAPPSASGGPPRSMRCGHAPSSLSTSSQALFSMLHWLSLPRSCNRLQFNVSGPGLTRGLAKSHPCPKLFARLPLHPRATTSQHRCRRCCLLFSLARRLSPPSRASLKRSVPSRSMCQVRSHTSAPAHRPTHQLPQPCTSVPPAAPDVPAPAPQPCPGLASSPPSDAGAEDPGDNFIRSAAERVFEGERRARGRGRRGGRGRGGRRAHSRVPSNAEDVGPVPEADPPAPERSTASQRRVLSAEAAFHAGLQTLDAVDLAATLRKRVLTLQRVPVQVRSTLRTAFRAGLQLVADETSAESTLRGWKLFYLAARMLLHRAPAEARIPTAELERRCELFRRGEWPCLLAAAEAAPRTPKADSLPASFPHRSRSPRCEGHRARPPGGAVSRSTGPRLATSRAGFLRHSSRAP